MRKTISLAIWQLNCQNYSIIILGIILPNVKTHSKTKCSQLFSTDKPLTALGQGNVLLAPICPLAKVIFDKENTHCTINGKLIWNVPSWFNKKLITKFPHREFFKGCMRTLCERVCIKFTILWIWLKFVHENNKENRFLFSWSQA